VAYNPLKSLANHLPEREDIESQPSDTSRPHHGVPLLLRRHNTTPVPINQADSFIAQMRPPGHQCLLERISRLHTSTTGRRAILAAV